MDSVQVFLVDVNVHLSIQDEADLSDEMQHLAENIPSSKLYDLFEELEMAPLQSAADLLCSWCEEGGDRIELARALTAVKLKGLAEK